MIGPKTRRHWSTQEAAQASETISQAGDTSAPSESTLCGHAGPLLRNSPRGWRIEADLVELHPPAPPEAYNMPHGMSVVPGKDTQTAIEILEFKRSAKVDGRMKLFPVRAVQEYVSDPRHVASPERRRRNNAETGVSLFCGRGPPA